MTSQDEEEYTRQRLLGTIAINDAARVTLVTPDSWARRAYPTTHGTEPTPDSTALEVWD